MECNFKRVTETIEYLIDTKTGMKYQILDDETVRPVYTLEYYQYLQQQYQNSFSNKNNEIRCLIHEPSMKPVKKKNDQKISKNEEKRTIIIAHSLLFQKMYLEYENTFFDKNMLLT
jgi:Cft2 family RNA processing exonuclease